MISLDERDREILKAHGITEEDIRNYLHHFEKNDWYVTLDRPCTVGDGIIRVKPEEERKLVGLFEAEARKGRTMKFVPASGAASRMFQCLWHLLERPGIESYSDLLREAERDKELREAALFFERIKEFAFSDAVIDCCNRLCGYTLNEFMSKGPLKKLAKAILDDIGLGHLPKALIPFHSYPDGPRTAFEEHVIEACGYVKDAKGVARLHFTVGHNQLNRFVKARTEIVEKMFAKRPECKPEIDFSVQSSSTDTPAVDPENRLFRDEKGRLLLRPGGHGALLKNLQNCNGDIVFIKNIDNVLPDDRKPPVIHWQKVLGGLLIRLEKDIFKTVEKIESYGSGIRSDFEKLCNSLGIEVPPQSRLSAKEMKRILDRPKRVCGVVRNVGAPGGGPFWVRDAQGRLSKQIVEQSQVRMTDPDQRSIWESSTHFNPVHIVCSLRDHRGRPYNLEDFVDYDAVIITRKHYKGKPIKVIEHPGLWNGSMAHWITLFVEIPSETFRPVKKITDLLD
ncbi:DUF4301 family protein [Thermodesulforhabdus norvegica]|uniref:DUF4301 domain-containing protein n=1 Tax=Thermodesulforhabdus norvegica TaxID=39841 RepID=A0A1I4TEB8_9BACT|nr:DUF4301 family protein [Thermodesulforhabdus norvegica]SFM74991.1 protein of unknown function [Thermodesulforhabdus norvegica]